jgi:hypothetical protein
MSSMAPSDVQPGVARRFYVSRGWQRRGRVGPGGSIAAVENGSVLRLVKYPDLIDRFLASGTVRPKLELMP